MIPLGKTLYLWRIERGLTQEELASKSQVSRPNLSVLEQGGRDVTLSTLRRLAHALEISPGVLADCVPPQQRALKPLSRNELDRMARWIVGEPIRLNKRETELARLVQTLMKHKLGIAKISSRTAREERTSWIRIQSEFRPGEFKNLLTRVDKLLGMQSRTT